MTVSDNNTIDAGWQYPVINGPLTVDDIRIYRGANYFSAGPVVLFRINLGQYNEVFTNQIDGFFELLAATLPTLQQHHCSEGHEGGLYLRIQNGTLLGHVMEHIAIELQTLAGMDVSYGKTRSTLEDGVYNVIFRYFDEQVGLYAGKAAINMLNSLLLHNEFDVFEVIASLVELRESRLLGPSTQAIVDEADKRGIPHLRLDRFNLVQLGTGCYKKLIRATISSDTSLIAVETADNKFLTNRMLKESGVQVPESILVPDAATAMEFHSKAGAPIVIKPVDGSLGMDLWLNLDDDTTIAKVVNVLLEEHEEVLAQLQVEGEMYRLLVIDYKFVAAVKLSPPQLTGDGVSTIKQLVDLLNKDPERKTGDKGKLSKVVIDEFTISILALHGLTEDSVLKAGEVLGLKLSGNPKLGGCSVDVTDGVHPDFKYLAERSARATGLNIAGIDIMAASIENPVDENNGFVIEINAAPDFRMHLMPSSGEPRNVAKPMIDMLFPPGNCNHVPLFAITGTVGKTTAALLLRHCLQEDGKIPGCATTLGLYSNEKMLSEHDATYRPDALILQKDPSVDSIILEISKEGILRRGLGYKFADFSLVLNVFDDHIGSDDIKYIEDLAYAKSVVAEEVFEDGYTILNADDELVVQMLDRLYSKKVLFSRLGENPAFKAHIAEGGSGVCIQEGRLTFVKTGKRTLAGGISEIPLTFSGKTMMFLDSILGIAACLMAYGIEPVRINKLLQSFHPGSDTLPGRMNHFTKDDKLILIDNAHNAAGFEALKLYLETLEQPKAGVFDAAGDRQDEEIRQLGVLASGMFDRVYLHPGTDPSGRKEGEIEKLLTEGLISGGMTAGNIITSVDASTAYRKAMSPQNNMIVILSSQHRDVIDTLQLKD